MHYVFIGLSVGSLAGGFAVWWIKFEPLRLYRGESGARPDRYGNFLRAELYRPEAAAWLRIVSLLWIFAPVALLIAVFLVPAA